MTRGEILHLLSDYAKEYCPTAFESIIRNCHMNELEKHDEMPQLDRKYSDALIVDFINFIGAKQGLDWGMYTEDLKKNDLPERVESV